MRKFLWILAVLSLCLISCKKKDPDKKTNIAGDWQLTRVELKAVDYGGESVDVYLRFDAAKTFSMYQKLGEGRYRVYNGSWSLSKKILSGSYSDGKAWGATYEIALDGNTLTLTSQTDHPEKDTYTRCTIPEEVIRTAE